MIRFYLKNFKQIKTNFTPTKYIISEIKCDNINDYSLKIYAFCDNEEDFNYIKSFINIIKNKDIICDYNDYATSVEPIVYLSEEELFYIKLKYDISLNN